MLATPRCPVEPGESPESERVAKGGERVAYIDVARALGVIGVVLGHAWYQSRVERITLSFDLPLFFFLSGFVYSEKYSLQPGLLAWKRLKTLYFPFVRWGLFWLVLHNVLFRLEIYSDKTGYLGQPTYLYDLRGYLQAAWRIITCRGTEPMAGALWFLKSLFFTNILFGLTSFLLVRAAGREIEWLRALAVVVLAVLGYLSNPFIGNRMHVGTSLVGILLFYWGVLYRRYESILTPKWYLAVAASAVVIFAGGGVYLGSNYYESGVLLVTVVPAGIYASLFAARMLRESRLLQYIGTNTIWIIGLHFIAFKIVSVIQISLYNHPSYFLSKFPVISPDHGWWAAYFVCGLFGPLALKVGVDRLILWFRKRA